jgi:hypothetical protein
LRRMSTGYGLRSPALMRSFRFRSGLKIYTR